MKPRRAAFAGGCDREAGAGGIIIRASNPLRKQGPARIHGPTRAAWDHIGNPLRRAWHKRCSSALRRRRPRRVASFLHAVKPLSFPRWLPILAFILAAIATGRALLPDRPAPAPSVVSSPGETAAMDPVHAVTVAGTLVPIREAPADAPLLDVFPGQDLLHLADLKETPAMYPGGEPDLPPIREISSVRVGSNIWVDMTHVGGWFLPPRTGSESSTGPRPGEGGEVPQVPDSGSVLAMLAGAMGFAHLARKLVLPGGPSAGGGRAPAQCAPSANALRGRGISPVPLDAPDTRTRRESCDAPLGFGAAPEGG